ncbi:MAG: winged helix DNA-binding protein [Kiloniellaceae bacterium]
MTGRARGRRAIVSSAHLVSERAAALSEFEYGLIVAGNAFERWIVRCMAAAGLEDLGALDILVLHSVNHRGREKKLADLCFVLNVEDTHTVSYAVKKLARLGLVEGTRRGKEIFYRTSEAGREACRRYREVREDCLVAAFGAFAGGETEARNAQIGEAAELLRALSGLYDQAARAAASL